jgi:hypothetical protein
MQCVTIKQRRLLAEEVEAELDKKDQQIEDLETKVAACTSELTHAQLERDWAKDEQRRAEEAVAQKRTRKVAHS